MSLKVFERNEEALAAEREKDEQRENRQPREKSASVYKIKKGKTTLRILGPYDEKGLWMREFAEHQVNLGGRWVYSACARPFGQPCPFCERGEELYRKGDEESIQIAKNFRPRSQFLFNAFVLSDPDGDQRQQGIVPLKSGVKVKRALLKFDKDAVGDEGYGDITSLEHGFNITIDRVGDTEFTVMPARKRTNIIEQLAVDGIDITSMSMHNLDQLLPPRSYEAAKAILEGSNTVPGFPTQAEGPVVVGSVPTVETTGNTAGDPVNYKTDPQPFTTNPVGVPDMPPPPNFKGE